MEELVITGKEHKLYKKFRSYLENFYKVKICMPKLVSLDSDMVFISVSGEESCRDGVKKFVSDKLTLHRENDKIEGNALVVTLSDSEDDSTSSDEGVSASVIECSLKSEEPDPSRSLLDESVLIIESPLSGICNSSSKKSIEISGLLGDSICIIENPENSEQSSQTNRKRRIQFKKKNKFKKVRSNASCSSDAQASELCEVTSTTTDDMARTEISIVEESKPFPEASTSMRNSLNFIPLLDVGKRNRCDKNTFNNQLGQSKRNKGRIIGSANSCSLNVKTKNDKLCTLPSSHNDTNVKEIIVIENPIAKVLTISRRPIVIDGSNIAREHGKVSRTFSAKGIQLAINYFLNRGHTQVTAFLPMFRRHYNPKSPVPTTNVEIIQELSQKQLVVFTPSRYVNGKCFQSYDDRFIVQLAAKNGGIIVSNDNFRDLLTENDSFKEAIEQRLLMYCFVGDEFMVPDDPLGRNGPKLDDFLCFPP